ncbi:nucleotide-sugar transporter [Atractiella rhizophila]|nr:nucleotide-sugar transporter [Atractiella rhizophila]
MASNSRLRVVSLVALTAQNSMLAILLHLSRSLPESQAYSPSSAVLLNEILKGLISLSVAARNSKGRESWGEPLHRRVLKRWEVGRWDEKICRLRAEILSQDCWKLGVPAILYVIQNLQFVAASNLDVATFQVTYQLKILTTALCSVLMLKKQLSPTKWISLFFLSIGVAIVQLASVSSAPASSQHQMNPLIGFSAVLLACFTSGLAGVYFEKVLKGSKVDLWVRNVQLSLFSLLPAITPALLELGSSTRQPLFKNFGFSAWSVVICQVLGGLITALVIKYADNILKGFATSLSIVLSFIAGAILFDAEITFGFLLGTAIVLSATYAYNLPDAQKIGRPGKGLIEKDELEKSTEKRLRLNGFGGNASARNSMEINTGRGTQRHVSMPQLVNGIGSAVIGSPIVEKKIG